MKQWPPGWPRITNPFAALIALLLLLLAIGFMLNQFWRWAGAEHATGTVDRVYAFRTSCGGGIRRPAYDCTDFSAQVRFVDASGKSYSLNTSAGSVRGHTDDIHLADFQQGHFVQIDYHSHAPERGRVNTPMRVWGEVLAFLFSSLFMLFVSFTTELDDYWTELRFGRAPGGDGKGIDRAAARRIAARQSHRPPRDPRL